MAPFDYRESFRGIRQCGRGAPKFDGVARTRHERVEYDQCFETLDELLSMRPHFLRELEENALDLFYLLALQLANPVPGLNRRRWLDEQRPSRLRCVVHYPPDRALCFPTHGNHVSAIAHGDGHVGHALMRFELRHRAL